MIGRLLGLVLAVTGSLVICAPAQARLDIRVDLASQRMSVTTPDGERHHWAVSSGRDGYRTPRGNYRPQRLERHWVSRKYGGAMPHAIFFRGGYAIHATSATGRLGSAASHGCIRLHPAHAAKLFQLVRRHGMGATRIAIQGTVHDRPTRYARSEPAGRRVRLAAGNGQPRAHLSRGQAPSRVAAKARVHHRAVAGMRGAVAARHPAGHDWTTARARLLERDGFLAPGADTGFRALGFAPLGPARHGPVRRAPRHNVPAGGGWGWH